MKIHVYHGIGDKIPLRAVPFYSSDSMSMYEDVLSIYNDEEILATDARKITADDSALTNSEDCPWILNRSNNSDIIKEIAEGREELYVHDNSNHTISIYRTVNDNGALILEIEYTGNFDFRGFLNKVAEENKEFNIITFMFPIARKRKPKVLRSEYSFCRRCGESNNYMGYRAYTLSLDN